MWVRHIYLHATVWKRCWVHLRMCVCGECDPPGFRSKQSSVKWLVCNLIDRLTPSSSLSSPHFFIVYHPFSFFLIIPPSRCMHSSVPFTPPSLSSSCSSPSCLTLDDINTSFCLRCDRITCGNTAHNHSIFTIWQCVCVCVHKFLYTNMYKNILCMETKAVRLSSHWWWHCSGLGCVLWNYYSQPELCEVLFSVDKLY